jgi:anti-sigma regulatory factor (Ser/Thr protein kinase)
VGGGDQVGAPPVTDLDIGLPFDDSAPRLARQFVARAAGSLPGDVRADASLLASELTTNAVRYGRPSITLRVRLGDGRLRVDVHDQGDPMPPWVASRTSSVQPRGRGLVIVNHLAASWGVTVSDEGAGKSVWFELPASAPITAS